MKIEGGSSEAAASGLEKLLGETIEALSRLDAGRVEALAEAAEEMAAERFGGAGRWPATTAGWRRAAASHWVLGHLVGETARQLAVQRRISDRLMADGGREFREYRVQGEARLAARMNAALVWRWARDPERRGVSRTADQGD